ncbi:hypothetical protein ABT093_40170, partial [Kitasatospora sp. NPDC002551]|uniref:hypothetical protein n=1 Tax=Kitasatospora sp. NPDC002551 TaxID=3154539 RepID=UPI00331FE0BF
ALLAEQLTERGILDAAAVEQCTARARELLAGRVVEREVDGTALWDAFPVRIAQAETTGELQERFAALDEGRVAPQVGQ